MQKHRKLCVNILLVKTLESYNRITQKRFYSNLNDILPLSYRILNPVEILSWSLKKWT